MNKDKNVMNFSHSTELVSLRDAANKQIKRVFTCEVSLLLYGMKVVSLNTMKKT